MLRHQLVELARSGAFIPHVYDYCDQCCQECPASARCLLHHVEAAEDAESADAPPGRGDQPMHALDFLRIVAGATGTAVSELDVLLADPSTAPGAPFVGDPLEVLGRHYAIQAGAFLRSIDPARWEEPAEAGADALTTIAWLQMIVPTKIYRALVSAQRGAQGASALVDDALATARLVLVSVEQSREALVKAPAADHDARVAALLELLETIRAAVERRFPGAVRFRRAGLDP